MKTLCVIVLHLCEPLFALLFGMIVELRGICCQVGHPEFSFARPHFFKLLGGNHFDRKQCFFFEFLRQKQEGKLTKLQLALGSLLLGWCFQRQTWFLTAMASYSGIPFVR